MFTNLPDATHEHGFVRHTCKECREQPGLCNGNKTSRCLYGTMHGFNRKGEKIFVCPMYVTQNMLSNRCDIVERKKAFDSPV